MHNIYVEKLAGKPESVIRGEEQSVLDWYGNIVVVKTGEEGEIKDLEQVDIANVQTILVRYVLDDQTCWKQTIYASFQVVERRKPSMIE